MSVPVTRVDQADREQEQGRAGEVDRDVFQPLGDPPRAGAVQHQAVGGDQQHLEEDEQVEHVAGEEGAVDAHELELEQRVEVAAAPVPALGGVDRDHHAPARR